MYERNERGESDERERDRRGIGDGSSSGISPALIAFVVIAILLIIFVFQNTKKRNVDIFFWDVTAPMWVVIGVSIAAGVVLDRLFAFWWRRRRRE